jgi:hypothetical protein
MGNAISLSTGSLGVSKSNGIAAPTLRVLHPHLVDVLRG